MSIAGFRDALRRQCDSNPGFAWELVEEGQVSQENFCDFVLTNPVRFYTSVNPDFFAGTRVEESASRILAEGA